MKSLRLSDLRKRSNNYFKRIGKVGYKSKKASQYIAERSYDALSKKLKEYIKEEKQQLIKLASNLVSAASEEDGVDVYQAIKSYALNRYNRVYSPQKKEIWELFKSIETAVYNHYNTYVYRLGYSASKYWFENVKFTNIEGSLVTTKLELPYKAQGTVYKMLEIIYDYSSHYFEAFMY